MDRLGRSLVALGLAIAVVGLLLVVANRFGLGRLPGDIVVRKKNVTFYFPIATSVIVSVVISVVVYLVQRFRR